MISSISSSTSALRVAILWALLAACAAPPERRESPAPPDAPRVAVLPATNASGTPAPAREITEAIERALQAAGVEVVGGDRMREWLAQHRIRHVAGVDRTAAIAARDDLGVEAIVVATVEFFGASEPPRLGISMRLVEAGADPRILWTHSTFRSGDDEPGLLRIGVVRELSRLQDRVVRELTASLAKFLAAGAPASRRCPAESRFRPQVSYRSGALERGRTYSVAVLPFRNQTDRPHAAEVVSLQIVQQLHAKPLLEVLEPGVVRENLLGNRIILEGGVSLETARLVLGSMDAELVVTGTVTRYDEGPGRPARAAFSLVVIDTRANRIVWESNSDHNGDEGLRLFERGRVRAAPALVCRMARHVADGLGSP